MNPISGSSAYNVQNSSTNPAQAAAAGTHQSGHGNSLTSAMLSDHAIAVLNAKEAQGNEQEKMLARFAKRALSSGGQLRLSPNQPPNEIAQYGIKHNQEVLVIKAKLNNHSEYEIISVGYRRNSEASVSMRLPASITSPQVQSTELQKRSLLGLPTELQQAIMGYVLTGSTKRQGAYDLSNLENSSRLLKSTLAGDLLLKLKHDTHKKLIGAIISLPISTLKPFSNTGLFALVSPEKRNNYFDQVINEFDDLTSICFIAESLDLFHPEQRARLVKAILDDGLDENGDVDMDNDIEEKGTMLASLAKSMHVITAHHAEIIDCIIKLPESVSCYAIGGLGKALHTLDTRSRDLLVLTALIMEDEDSKGFAIGGLAEGMSALSEEQRDVAFDAALQFDDETTFNELVLPGLIDGFKALTSAQQLSLVNTVAQMGEEDRCGSLRALGEALKETTDLQHIDILEALTNSALSIQSENLKATALAFVGSSHAKPFEGSYSEKQKQLLTNIFKNVIEMQSETIKSRAIAGLGGGLSAFSTEQRSELVEACLSMRNEDNKSTAIAGIGEGLQALNHEQREKLINHSLGMAYDENKARAIAGLGVTLRELTTEQQAKLVNSAVKMDIRFKNLLIHRLRNVGDIQLLDRLIDAALSLPQISPAPGGRSPQAGALASLVESELL